MDHLAYNAGDKKVTTSETEKKKKTLLSLPGKKRWVIWSILGTFFILLYTGGIYYILFTQRNSAKPDSQIYPTPFSATATPAPPTPTAVPTVTPAAVNTVIWKSYSNKKYGITVLYPKEITPTFNKTEAGVEPYLLVFTDPQSSTNGKLSVNVQDSAFIGQSDVQPRSIIALDLLNFAKKKRELNASYVDPRVPSRRVSGLTSTTFLGKPAYSFTVSGSYNDDREYRALAEEYTYVFTQNGSYKIIISYPTGNALLKRIFETITFF